MSKAKTVPYTRLNPASLVDQACEAIDLAILDGQLQPGDRIAEADLAAQFGISRGPLREAISRLEGRRLVERVPHMGVRVAELDEAAIREVFLLREVLEGLACKLAAASYTDDHFKNWEHLLCEHEKAVLESNEAYNSLRTRDWDFHLSIIRATGNQRLEAMLIKDVYYQLRLFRYRHENIAAQRNTAIDGHKQILAALAKRDGIAAEAAMRKHIALACDNLVNSR